MIGRLNHVAIAVKDLDRSTALYRDTLGLELKFASPFWSEFATGETTLALHPASAENPAGGVQLGFATDDLRALRKSRAKGRDEAPERLVRADRRMICRGCG